MAFQIILTPNADADIEEIYTWIARDSKGAAQRWYIGLETEIATLRAMPRRCRLADEHKSLPGEVRQLLYRKHRILFQIEGNTVRILHIRHGARDRVAVADLT